MREVAAIIAAALSDRFAEERESLIARSRALMDRYPLYPGLG